MSRKLPDIPLTDSGDDYAVLVAQGWDSIQEAFNVTPGPGLLHVLEQAKAEAASKADENGGEGVAEREIGGEFFQVQPHGARGGKRFRFENDDFIVMVGSPKTEWQVSVRYSAAGLWEHGAEALHNRAYTMMVNGGFLGTGKSGADIVRVSRADYAFDFHSPAFTAEMRRPSQIYENVVAHAEVKKRLHGKMQRESSLDFDFIGTSSRGQTFTLGARTSLQIQVYDKTTEIIEASGKEWMRDLWARDTGLICERDVWRLEVRMWRDWLRDRRIKTNWELFDAKSDLLTEALFNRRVVVGDHPDARLRRRPVHPLWSRAIREAGEGTPRPLGRIITMRRDEYRAMLLRNIAGCSRVLSVAGTGTLDENQLAEDLDSARQITLSDGGNNRKVANAQQRLRFIDEAR